MPMITPFVTPKIAINTKERMMLPPRSPSKEMPMVVVASSPTAKMYSEPAMETKPLK
ncbi:hypothetical protein SDC9_157569 [bioreactor metagenome]|uniref:Uncharacterized protein n=1 Tax=bioreactor metagenome TaxID=1076179 RepID=A0A645FCI1_9ZZZZ